MQISEAAKLFLEYHKSHSKENTARAYNLVLNQILGEFRDENFEEISTEKILSFSNRITEGKKRQTKRTRYSHVSDINERRLTLRDPKSGREHEFIFIPQRLANRLKDYIWGKGI